MATLLPPPKRQKVYHGVPEPEPGPPKETPNIVVQFVSDEDGESLAPAVNLPANLSREALEALVNKISTKVSTLLRRGMSKELTVHIEVLRMTNLYHLHFILHCQ